MSGGHFDHAFMLVSSLDDGRAAMERAGFRVTPDGYHGEVLGTANATVVLPDRRTYFELLAVVAPTPHNVDYGETLARRGNVLFGLAFNWPAAEAHAAFVRAGVADGAPFDFDRAVNLPDGTRDARFSVAQMAAGGLPAVSAFAITHHTPDVVWRADYLTHPNGALAITGLTGVCAEVAAVEGPWKALFGERATTTEDGLSVRTGTAVIEFLTPHAFRSRYGRDARSGPTGLEILSIAVEDVDLCGWCLERAGVRCTHLASGAVLTDFEPSLGASFLFEPAAGDEQAGGDRP